jgi:hypothetical protein
MNWLRAAAPKKFLLHIPEFSKAARTRGADRGMIAALFDMVKPALGRIIGRVG